jgi:hypothetical protein
MALTQTALAYCCCEKAQANIQPLAKGYRTIALDNLQ